MFGKGKATNESKGGDWEIPPPGSHAAVLVRIIDLGTQVEDYQGNMYETRQAVFIWEIPDEKPKDKDHGHMIIKKYNLPADGVYGPKSGLRKLLVSLRGRDYAEGEEIDPAKLLGQPFLLTITHGKSAKGNDIAKLEGITRLPKDMKKPTPTQKPAIWEIGNGTLPTEEWIPWLFGQNVIDLIKLSPEWKDANGGANGSKREDVPEEEEDSIPF